MKFPKKENDIVALAATMVAGYTEHAADFPSVDVAELQTTLNEYQTDLQSQSDAKSQALIATETKSQQLDALTDLMKNDLKVSEVDVADEPEKLSQIGWGPKAPPQPTVAPGQPDDFLSIAEGQGTVWLKWSKSESGGAVRNYLVQRRDQNEADGPFTSWTLVNSTFNSEINLTDQPRGIEMEYRVIATNEAGQSIPSNTAAVVL